MTRIAGKLVAPLALGGNVFGWTADEATSLRILDAFVDGGGTMIDTADVYSAWVDGHQGGESERVIGNWLRRNPAKREKIIIATKVGYLDGSQTENGFLANLDPDVITRATDASLQRLGIETIDLLYQHGDNAAVPLADSLGAMDGLRLAGKIAAVGLSNFDAPRVEEALEVCAVNEFVPPVALQNWYNLMERGKYEGALQAVTLRAGLSEFPYYSLANGFLTGKYRTDEDLSKSVRGGRSADYLTSDKGRAVLAALDEIAGQTHESIAAVALAWLKVQPGIGAPIASATSVEQIDELLAGMRLKLTVEQVEYLTQASE
nr:aldo/keto reductase [uncultured Sphingomonas sp.]